MANAVKQVALDQLVKVLDRVPIVSGVKNDLASLRALLYDRRPPRIAALGLAGSGRSSLIRALIEREEGHEAVHADHGQWVHIEHIGAKVDWMELDVDAPDAQAQWDAAVAKEAPDVVLLMVEPQRLDQARAIVTQSAPLLGGLAEEAACPILPLLTHSDLIGQGDDDIEAARRKLAAALAKDKSSTREPVRAVSAISGKGLQALSEALVSAVPIDARLETARALTRASEARIRIGNEIVQACTAMSVTVGVTPIPFSDMVLLGPLQAMMVSSLAYLSGRTWGRKTAAEFLASLGVVGGIGIGLRFSAQTIAKFVPGAGNAVSAGVAGAGTTAMGQSAIKYFLRSS